MNNDNTEMMDQLSAKFDEKLHRQRTIIRGKKEVVLDYVPGNKIIERLNKCLGADWSFEIVDKIVDIPHGQIAVHGRLTVGVEVPDTEEFFTEVPESEVDKKEEEKDEDVAYTLRSTNARHKIVKEQWGGTYICLNNAGRIVSLGDDMKIASTDALKKCATQLGVGLYLYEQDDVMDEVPTPTPPPDSSKVEEMRGAVTQSQDEEEQPSEFATEQQVNAMRKVLESQNVHEDKLLEYFKVSLFDKIKSEDAGAVITMKHPFWSTQE